jgi:hypothetical protein
MSDVLNKMLGRGEAFHEKTEKLAKKLHSDKCSCNKCKMHKDKYSHNDVMYVAGTPVSLNRP